MNAEKSFTNGIESNIAMIIVLEILLEKGFINRPTYESIIKQKFSKLTDMV